MDTGGISSALAMLMAGSQQAFLRRYSADALVNALQQYSITATIAVPTMAYDLLNYAATKHTLDTGASELRLPHMRRLLIGAGALDADAVPKLAAIMPAVRIFSAYGMTECASSLTFHTLHDAACSPLLLQSHRQEQQRNKECGLFGACVGNAAPGVELGLLPLPSENSVANAKDAVSNNSTPQVSISPDSRSLVRLQCCRRWV